MTSQTNGNSSLTSWVYDSANRVTDVWHKKSDNTTVLGHYAYQYDSVGNVVERDDNDSSVTVFGYDASDQLTSEARSVVGAYSVSYTYDHNGNRKTKVLGGVTDNYSYGNHDQLNSVSFGGGGSKSYAYDSNGNCTSVTVGSNVTSLAYDYENRAVGITYPSSATNSFQYNGLDLRTQKVDSAGTFNYVTDGTSPASPVLKDGAATYTPGLSERRGSTSKFYHSDALGSTRGITDTSQAATDAILYDAFGMTVSRSGTTPTPFGFVGGAQYQTDSDSGLQLLGHRYYDASIGRFISSDPIQAGTNYYAYCDNNPLSEIDPEGTDGGLLAVGVGLAVLDPEPVGKAIGIGIIVVVAAGAVLAAGYIYYKAHQDDGFRKDGGGEQEKNKDRAKESGGAQAGAGGHHPDPKKPKKGGGGKAGSTDIPSWAKGEAPHSGENGNSFAKRLLDDKYGDGGYKTGPGSEFNKLRKFGDRHFE